MNKTDFFELLADYSGVPVKNISSDTRLDWDLGLNSMDFVALLDKVEERFDIIVDDSKFDEMFSSTYTAGELLNIISECC